MGGEGFPEDRLQDDEGMPVYSVWFIAGDPLLFLKTIIREDNLFFRCGGLKSF
jgi:hypothetical protein